MRQTLRLSDAYEKKQENPEPELTVTVYNINWGYNEEITDACRMLKEYAMYVEQVRIYAKQMSLAEAVEKAIDYCIMAGILSEFLRKNRADIICRKGKIPNPSLSFLLFLQFRTEDQAAQVSKDKCRTASYRSVCEAAFEKADKAILIYCLLNAFH